MRARTLAWSACCEDFSWTYPNDLTDDPENMSSVNRTEMIAEEATSKRLETNAYMNTHKRTRHCNLQLAGLASHPMPPAALESRMLSPFALHYGDGFSYAPAAYILRTPQSGGHWIALLPPSVLNLEVSEAATSVLCDSLESIPYVLTFAETENLLTACALEGVRADAGFGHDISWGAFLITGPAMPAP